MKKTLKLLIASLALASTGHALPVILYQHTGNTDPTSILEGWSELNFAGGTTKGPITDPVGPTPAWNINNTVAGDTGAYTVVPTPAQVTDAALGWSLSVTLRVTEANVGPGGSMIALYRDGVNSYQMHFGSNASGNATVSLMNTASGGTYFVYTVPSQTGTGYNTFELLYSNTTQSATLYVNSVPQSPPGYTGFPFAPKLLAWGDGSTQTVVNNNIAKANYSKVVFSILPKPCGLLRNVLIETVALNGETVPTAPVGAKFNSFGSPAINNLKHLAFQATLAIDPVVPVSAKNDLVIFADQGSTSLKLMAREGSIAPGTNAPYLLLNDPVNKNSDNIAFISTLGAPATTANNSGIWSDSTVLGTVSLVARKGSIAPDTNGALFQTFREIVLPDVGGTVFLADLKVGTGVPAVTSANKTGVWGSDAAGVVTLLMRVGDTFSVEHMGNSGCCMDKIIRSISIFACQPTVGGQGRNWELGGDLGFKASFTDGTNGVFHLQR